MSAATEAKGRCWVSAFGKHPGWDDHMDDIGLATPELVAFKRLLYFEGIGTNIDSGTWSQLPSENRLPGFGHAFLVSDEGRVIVGRLWASTDRKGRSLYPMVVCAQIENTALAPAVLTVMPELIRLQACCQAEESAVAVQTAVATAQERLSSRFLQMASAPEVSVRWGGPLDVLRWPERLPPEEEGLGLLRVCHRLVRDFDGYRTYLPSSRAGAPPPQQMRVPVGGASDEAESLLLWTAFLRTGVPGAVPLFLFRPFACDWLDILAGTPQARQFACLLSDRPAIPWVTDIPYTLGADSMERRDQFIAAWQTETAQGAPAGLWQVPTRERENALSGLWRKVQGLVR